LFRASCLFTLLVFRPRCPMWSPWRRTPKHAQTNSRTFRGRAEGRREQKVIATRTGQNRKDPVANQKKRKKTASRLLPSLVRRTGGGHLGPLGFTLWFAREEFLKLSVDALPIEAFSLHSRKLALHVNGPRFWLNSRRRRWSGATVRHE
jgi:hypothetical protein